jgi:hypothetical protein
MHSPLAESFHQVFESIKQHKIKEGVDEMGIDAFIKHCARLAGGTGAACGFGGFMTMAVGVPVDVFNNVFQQFRVTLAIIYHKTGRYSISFEDFMKIVGLSLGVEVGATLTKAVMLAIARQIIVRMSASTAGKAVPFLGAFIGAGVNYWFVKGIGASVMQLNLSRE